MFATKSKRLSQACLMPICLTQSQLRPRLQMRLACETAPSSTSKPEQCSTCTFSGLALLQKSVGQEMKPAWAAHRTYLHIVKGKCNDGAACQEILDGFRAGAVAMLRVWNSCRYAGSPHRPYVGLQLDSVLEQAWMVRGAPAACHMPSYQRRSDSDVHQAV